MKTSRKLLWKLLLAALSVTLVVALAAVAIGAGTTSDPLVTVSYLENQFSQSVQSSVATQISTASTQLTNNFNSRITSFRTSLSAASTSAAAPSAYTTLTLAAGDMITVTAGQEILFLEGTATVDVAGLTDTAVGSVLAAGGTLLINRLYMATYECTITAADDVKIMVR